MAHKYISHRQLVALNSIENQNPQGFTAALAQLAARPPGLGDVFSDFEQLAQNYLQFRAVTASPAIPVQTTQAQLAAAGIKTVPWTTYLLLGGVGLLGVALVIKFVRRKS